MVSRRVRDAAILAQIPAAHGPQAALRAVRWPHRASTVGRLAQPLHAELPRADLPTFSAGHHTSLRPLLSVTHSTIPASWNQFAREHEQTDVGAAGIHAIRTSQVGRRNRRQLDKDAAAPGVRQELD
jgi:hypothetical protein